MTPQKALEVMRSYKQNVDAYQKRIKQSEVAIQQFYNSAYSFMAKHEDMEWPDQTQLDEYMELFNAIDDADTATRGEE